MVCGNAGRNGILDKRRTSSMLEARTAEDYLGVIQTSDLRTFTFYSKFLTVLTHNHI